MARHRVGVAAASLVLVMLATFGIVQAVQLRRITREKERADRVTAFMVSMFRVSDPHRAKGRDITAREILDEAAKNIGADSSVDPQVRAALSHVMGTVYSGLGSDAQAEVLFRRSAQLRQNLLGAGHRETLESVRASAVSVAQQGRIEEAAAELTAALATSRRALGSGNSLTRQIAHSLAGCLAGLGRYAEAEALLRETSQYDRTTLTPEKNGILATSQSAAQLLYRRGEYSQAKTMFDALVEAHTRGCGPESPCTLAAKVNLALTIARGDPARAEQLLFEVLATQRRVLGPAHPDTAATLYNLACLAARAGKLDSALTFLQDAFTHGLADMRARSRETRSGFRKFADRPTVHGNHRRRKAEGDGHRALKREPTNDRQLPGRSDSTSALTRNIGSGWPVGVARYLDDVA